MSTYQSIALPRLITNEVAAGSYQASELSVEQRERRRDVSKGDAGGEYRVDWRRRFFVIVNGDLFFCPSRNFLGARGCSGPCAKPAQNTGDNLPKIVDWSPVWRWRPGRRLCTRQASNMSSSAFMEHPQAEFEKERSRRRRKVGQGNPERKSLFYQGCCQRTKHAPLLCRAVSWKATGSRLHLGKV
jgi:hypothetical protein